MILPALRDNHVGRCFHLRYVNSFATAFLHSCDDKVAFVTAAHAIAGASVGDNLHLRLKNGWASLEITELETDQRQDIAAFSLKGFITTGSWKEPKIALLLAQPVVYLGFPHSMSGDYPGQAEWVTPLAKVAHFSGNVQIREASLMVLDGLNNPGFSGGPIFHQPYGVDSPTVGLVGMVHGFKFEQEQQGQVYRSTGVDGRASEPERGLFVRLNSGMILASSRVHIDRLLSKLEAGLVIQAEPE